MNERRRQTEEERTVERSKYIPINNANAAINKTRGFYADWARKNQVSYYELMVLSLLYEWNCCTQKEIRDAYGLPKQTVNGIIGTLAKAGRLVVSRKEKNKREKEVSLTEEGRAYAKDMLAPLRALEKGAIKRMGEDQYELFLDMVNMYGRALEIELIALEIQNEIF